MKTTILLVEDSKFLRMASERALTRAGYTVVTAGDGEQALRLAQELVPDLILLDMLLPRLDGQQVLLRLKADSRTAPIPVIVQSSLVRRNGEKLKRDGAAACLQKCEQAVDDSDGMLLSAVAEALRQAERVRKARTGA